MLRSRASRRGEPPAGAPPRSGRARRRGVAASVLLTLSLVVRANAEPAAAPRERAPADLQLEWHGGNASCHDGRAMRLETLELLERAPTRPLVARAYAEREGEGWRVRLETESGEERGLRELHGETCRSVQRAVSLVLAMILESELPLSEGDPPPEPSPAPPPGDEPEPAPPSPAPPEPTPAAPPQVEAPRAAAGPRVRLLIAPDVSVGIGVVPSTTLGFGGTVGVAVGRFELGVQGRHWLAAERALASADPQGPAHDVSRQELLLQACLRVLDLLGHGELALSGCLGGGATRISAEAKRVTGAGDQAEWFGLATAGLRLRYFSGPNLFVGVQPAVTWTKELPLELEIDGTEQPVYTSAPIYFRGSLEVGARF